MPSSVAWEPIEGFWEHKSEAAEVRRLTQYNGRNNGIGIRMTYLQKKSKGATEFGGALLPSDVRLCRAIPLPAPDWSTAPAWAEWWAVDPDGYCHWFNNEPILHEHTTHRDKIGPHWSHHGSRQSMYDAINIPLGVDWRLLKVARPTEATE